MIDQAKRDAIIGQTANWFSPESLMPYEQAARAETSQAYPTTIKNDIFSGSKPKYAGGIALFSCLALETIEILITEKYADLNDAQNDSPPLASQLRFMRDHPGFTANGYAVEAARDDCRVTVTGLDFDGYHSKKVLAEFKKFSTNASEKTIAPYLLSCWWD